MNERDTENSQLLDSFRNVENGENEEIPDEKASKFCNPLISIIIFLVIIVITLLALVVFWRIGGAPKAFMLTGNKPSEKEVCSTPECITLSSTLLNWQNPSIDPCYNFYEYSCGRYQEHTMNDGTRINEKDIIVMKLIKQFVLKNESTTSQSEIALKLLYNTCVNSHKPEELHQHIKSIQKEVFQNIRKIGAWPIADENWDSSNFDLNEMLSNMAKLHIMQFGFFESGIIEYPMFESSKQLVIRPAMMRFVVPLDELVKATRTILKLNGINISKDQLIKDVKESLDLDAELNNFHVDPQPQPASLSELKEAVPNIDFEKIIRSFLNSKTGNWTSLKKRVSSARFQSFFGEKRNISSIISQTEPRVLANYLILKYIEYSYFYFAFGGKMFTETDYCLEIVTTILPRAALRVFVRNHFKKENMQVASKMVELIKDAFVELIQNSTWLHDSTKESAVLKVKSMKKVVGYTEEYERKGALDEMYQTLHISSTDSFFTLMTKINRFKTEQLMDYVSSDSLLNPIDALTIANAFYFPSKNLLNVLVPFLDKPLFDFKYPQYAAMAGVGRVLAHEIGHAFDTNGRYTDEVGQTRDWWTEEDKQMYDKKSECFVEQFEQFDDPSYVGKNGTEVLPEMIADALGIEAVWIAFKKLDLTGEPSLYQFEHYDYRRLYYQIAALDFCSPGRIDAHSPKYGYKLSHPTNRFRINGAFANSRSFAEAYNCPVGSTMNPEKRCDLF